MTVNLSLGVFCYHHNRVISFLGQNLTMMESGLGDLFNLGAVRIPHEEFSLKVDYMMRSNNYFVGIGVR